MTHKPLKLWHNDAAGHEAPKTMVGKFYFHPKTGSIYTVKNVVFDAQRSLWMVVYSKVNINNAHHHEMPECDFVHTVDDFKIEGRFVEIKK